MRARGKNSLNERQSRNAPHPVDIHVGSRLRERRIVLGMSQQQLAASLGAQFSTGVQIRTGEKTYQRRPLLYDLGKVLGVPVAFFFEDVPDASTPAAPPASGGHSDPLIGREAAELFAAYRAISNPVVRHRLRQLAKALSEGPNGSTATATRSQGRRPSRRVRTNRGREVADQ